MTDQARDQQRRLKQAAAAGLAACALAGAVAFGVSDAAWRTGLVAGVVTGAAGGLVGLVLLALTVGRTIQASVAAMGAGFFARLMLVAVGLVVTIRVLHAEPFGFVAAFFPLFFAFAALELWVVSSRRALPAPLPETSSHG